MKPLYLYLLIPLFIAGMVFQPVKKASAEHKKSKDIIKFSHSKHAELADCAGCHSKAASAVSLKDRLLPTKEDCAACHDVNDDKQCSTCHYDGVFEPLQAKDRGLFFNHKKHISDNTNCAYCHQGISEVAYAGESKNADPSMTLCSGCHNNSVAAKASNECSLCHQNTADLSPVNHKSANFIRNHKMFAGATMSNCQMCHTEESCEACHTATEGLTEMNSKTDFYAPYTTYDNLSDKNLQKVRKVHDANYRFFHGIDAKSKSTECSSCHKTETFCQECHSTGNENRGDFGLNGILPSSHLKTGFTTLGVGSGGGEHAKLAKRDIESCASCHDAQGADPVCITCHVDNDGVKGTNPKTHASGFAKDWDGGDWHDNAGSVCYTCHTDANAKPNGIKGVGFCGYCHK